MIREIVSISKNIILIQFWQKCLILLLFSVLRYFLTHKRRITRMCLQAQLHIVSAKISLFENLVTKSRQVLHLFRCNSHSYVIFFLILIPS